MRNGVENVVRWAGAPPGHRLRSETPFLRSPPSRRERFVWWMARAAFWMAVGCLLTLIIGGYATWGQ